MLFGVAVSCLFVSESSVSSRRAMVSDGLCSG